MRSLVIASGLIPRGSVASRRPARQAQRSIGAPSRGLRSVLLRSQGARGLDSARGRIAMDFGGDACDGYTLNYRQVTVLNSNESGARTVDTQTATFEAGDGLSMRFKMHIDKRCDGQRTASMGMRALRPTAPWMSGSSSRKSAGFSASRPAGLSRPSTSSASSRPARQGQTDARREGV